ncbi:DUF3000 domain-containing protein [Trueperella bialowiezensis]|uniref:Protein of uncharacterized function (DUF3000) n=1 Tax=Trueperella bialowiezensis TaxID=312285 RepID=A0A448PBZ3_9ACTO|nr:DUF3000 domain-containing protein [Trueperella bialowiezensis]VEI12499.1 Protein of uncharacterised function (DUF3000) [Trueperella bialowiezensis]
MTTNQPTAEFLTALSSLKGQTFRPELRIGQIPGPTQIAPWAVALQAEVFPSADHDEAERQGAGRFAVLHDPQTQPAWNGTFRIVVHAQAPMDSVMGDDPLLGEVAWSWLRDALDNRGASYHSLNGTVTRVFNETFGGLHINSARVDLEVRASWTPQTEYLTEHVHAWADFLASISGLGPWSDQVATLARKVERI